MNQSALFMEATSRNKPMVSSPMIFVGFLDDLQMPSLKSVVILCESWLYVSLPSESPFAIYGLEIYNHQDTVEALSHPQSIDL